MVSLYFRYMLLNFDINKAIAAAAYLIEKDGGSESMFVLVKKLYYADRLALISWGKSITGDSLSSMNRGPVVSTIYNLMKGEGKEKHLNKWNKVIRRRENSISLKEHPDNGSLSEREVEILEKSRHIINQIKGPIYLWMHDHCPEWTHPRGSSLPIDPRKILELAGRSDEEINEIEDAEFELRFVNNLLDTR